MKINVEFTVKVENKGEENETTVSVSLDKKYIDVRTAIELAMKNLDDMLIVYIGKLVEENGAPLSEKQAEKIINNVTFKKMYEI
jgi:hypothetical protein